MRSTRLGDVLCEWSHVGKEWWEGRKVMMIFSCGYSVAIDSLSIPFVSFEGEMDSSKGSVNRCEHPPEKG